MKAKAEKWKQVIWKKQQWYREKEKLKNSYTFRRLKEAILFVEPEIEVEIINMSIIEPKWALNLKYEQIRNVKDMTLVEGDADRFCL